MATRHKKNKKPSRGGKIALICFAALMLALALTAGVAALNANFVRLRRAEVVLPDLPAAFDGVTILYASDIDLCGVNTPEKSGALFRRLQSLKPDVLLLGGDYTSSTLLEILNRPEGQDADIAEIQKKRARFFQYISEFEAPLGKFAIAAPEEPEWSELSDVMAAAGVDPLFNSAKPILRGDATLWVAGIARDSASLNSVGTGFSRSDCVLAVAYSPSVLPVLLTSEARDGGQWIDLALCGHTHGGQIRLFGRSVLPLDDQEKRRLSGWQIENSLPILTTEGIGCEGVNLRLGTAPEAWLLTLRVPD